MTPRWGECDEWADLSQPCQVLPSRSACLISAARRDISAGGVDPATVRATLAAVHDAPDADVND